MTQTLTDNFNPRWLAFLTEKGLSPSEADSMDRPDRISLNAEFMCWNVKRMDKSTKRYFWSY